MSRFPPSRNLSQVLAKIIGLLGMSNGLPFSAYETAGFDINLHMHPSGFPVRHSEHSDELEVLRATALPNATSVATDYNTSCSASKDALKYFLGTEDELLVDFISCLLVIDPRKRPTPKQALKHRFLCDTSD
jgi:serine/threonine protein kinase